jgi:hypothetical protein
MVRRWNEVSLVFILGTEDKTMTCGMLYNIDLLKSLKINTLWENCRHFPLAYKNLTKLAALERGNIRIP